MKAKLTFQKAADLIVILGDQYRIRIGYGKHRLGFRIVQPGGFVGLMGYGCFHQVAILEMRLSFPQANRKGSPLPRLALHTDLPSVHMYILLYQMQSDPSSHRPILRIETVEQMRKVTGLDTTSRIDNPYKDPVSLFRQLYPHATSLRRKLKSVREKIEKYLLQ